MFLWDGLTYDIVKTYGYSKQRNAILILIMILEKTDPTGKLSGKNGDSSSQNFLGGMIFMAFLQSHNLYWGNLTTSHKREQIHPAKTMILSYQDVV